jgi:hypothetical protein
VPRRGPFTAHPWRRRLAGAAIAGVTVALTALPATAQTLTGVLRGSRGDLVSGAYVVLLDRDSLEVTRALTNPLGEFVLHAPRPASYRLRTERIGFRSVVAGPYALGNGDSVAVELVVEPIVLTLSPLVVTGAARECRVIGEQAIEVLTIWEEARKVLSAVAWSELQEQFVHEMERFERFYDTKFVLRREQRSSVPTRHVLPFRSRSVQELETLGYVAIENDSVVYEAPDGEVFFSEPFLASHCFRLQPPGRGDSAMIGLRFEPVRGKSLPDVQGVFWVDPGTAALKRLELTYVNVGVWQRERGAAAELEFERLPDGRWFVSRWWIRMPVVRKVESLKGPVWDLQEAIVGFEEEGGEVRRVFALDGRTVYARGRAMVRGVVFDSTTGAGLAGAFVRLTGTDWVTITQIDGSYWLPDLPEGRYAVSFSHPRAALYGVTDEQPVALTLGREAVVNLALPSPGTIVQRRCAPRLVEEQGLLVGRVRRVGTDSALAGARVLVAWLDGDRLRTLEMRTDSLGVYRACVPRRAPLSVEVAAEGAAEISVPAVFGDLPVHVLDVEVRPPPTEPAGRRVGPTRGSRATP